MTELHRKLCAQGIACQAEASLSELCTFRIGGSVSLLVRPHSEETLCASVRLCREHGVRYRVIGNGSNLLFADGGFDGALIVTTDVTFCETAGTHVYASAGLSLSVLARAARDKGLEGLVFAFGIPGTVGGAIRMNAGAYGGQMSDVVERVRLYEPSSDTVMECDAEQMHFSYRHSLLAECEELICLGAFLQLRRGDPDKIAAQMRQNMQSRREKQPLEYPSAGSFFKRPEGHFAGKLIEDCGLKGYTVGGAAVSEKHAGFLINKGNATCADVLSLAEHVRRVVFETYAVSLENEVEWIG